MLPCGARFSAIAKEDRNEEILGAGSFKNSRFSAITVQWSKHSSTEKSSEKVVSLRREISNN
jgi:hypothetical protein